MVPKSAILSVFTTNVLAVFAPETSTPSIANVNEPLPVPIT